MKIVCLVYSFVVIFLLYPFAITTTTALKACTNKLTQSHTLRYQLSTSKNQTWKEEMMMYHHHLTPTDDSVWESLLPRKLLKEEQDHHDWTIMYRKIKNLGLLTPPQQGFLKEVSLHDVRLNPHSMHARAQLTNLEYLLMLDVDSLLWSFRKTAGLPTPGKPYGGWEDPKTELRGHFVGHYLSASALMWASTHNDTLKEKMSALVANLSACQKKLGTGYLSAFPSNAFDRLEELKPVWAPYYTIHKIMAGLLDQHTIAGDPHALQMLKWMVEYFYNRVQNVIAKYTISRHYQSMEEEAGGMNDILYKLYSITGDPKHLFLAHLFDKPCFLGLLAVQANDISDLHANTHIPVVVGSQMRYEITGDPLYKDMGTFFMSLINSSHSYATGGTSVTEWWHNPKRMADNLNTPETEESCTTYNMLKVSRHLFRWTKEAKYADYYERALTNGVLGIQRGTEPGVMIYMLPLGPGASKAKSEHGWGTKFNSFWCCYGTGIESFSKLGDSIYFEQEGKDPTLYIIQYISSSFTWKSGGFILNQTVVPTTSNDPYLRVTFTFSPTKGSSSSSTLNFRIPAWTRLNGATAMLNSETLTMLSPGNFLSITRKWSANDKLTLQFPITLRTELIKDDRSQFASLQAILYGPYLLAGHTTGDWNITIMSNSSIDEWITPIPANYNSQLVTFSQNLSGSTFVLTNSNQSSLQMKKLPEPGTSLTPHATFRLVPSESSSKVRDIVGKSVMLEPYDLPGMFLKHLGAENSHVIVDSNGGVSSVFNVVKGLNGERGTISLEAKSKKGCFVCSTGSGAISVVKLKCKSKSKSQANFKRDASFRAREGLNQYNPISFVAKGAKRNYVLEPLYKFRDETYTVYFNIHASSKE